MTRQPSTNQRWSAADTIAITAVTAAAAVIRAVHLTLPPVIIADENFYAREGCIYALHLPAVCGIPLDAVNPHPPLGKWLIGLGIRAFGFQPFGWRIVVLIAGIACVPILYLLARRLLGSTRGAAFASSLLAVDFMHFVHTRVALIDIILALFVLASFLFVVLDRDYGKRSAALFSRPWLLAAGLAAGAATATKWVGLGALAGVATLSILWSVLRASPETLWAQLYGLARKQWRPMILSLTVAPLFVYVLSYVPRIDGSILAAPWARGSWTRNFAREQLDILNYHLHSSEVYWVHRTNWDVSPAWSWPLIRRAEHYYFRENGDQHARIMSMGNPLIWWSALAALVYLGVQSVRGRSNDAAHVVFVAMGVLYVPFLLISGVRSAPFLHDILPCVPFMCLALAAVAETWKHSIRNWVIPVFTAAAVLVFMFFYPVLTGATLTQDELRARQWFQDCKPAAGMAAPAGWCWQ